MEFYLVSYLGVVLDVYTTVLEDSILHFDVIQQGVLCVKPIEKSVFVNDRLSLTWNLPVILGPGACLGKSDDTLARFDQVHALWPLVLAGQELTVGKFNEGHVQGDWD